MSYEVLARKWRPQQFSDVVGQEHVTRTLANAIESGRTAHAYLFVGPRGVGKTSVARIFAKALNCREGPTTTPCGVCDSCNEITGGTSLDVLEIDGASNNGVEQVRELRDTVKYAPARGPYKVYIIDEVHMLSNAAFNALLKTLEEPPPHVKFLFATTEPDKILATIISRCQRFDLRRIPVGAIIERLELIAKTEKIKIGDDALLAIARGSEGGLRDAESALDQLISFKGNELTEEDVLAVFGLVARGVLEELSAGILAGDVRAIVRMIHELDEGGKDLRRLLLELLEHFRNLLVCMHLGDDDAVELDLTEAQVKTLKAQADSTNMDRILRVTSILTETDDRMKFALSRRTLMETALIRCARAATVVSLEQILRKVNELLAEGGGGAAVPAQGRAVTSTPAACAVTQSAPTVREAPVEAALSDGELFERLVSRWPQICERTGKMAVMVRASLPDAHPVSVTGNEVTIALDPEFETEMGNLKAARNRRALEKVIGEELKPGLRAVFVLAEPEAAGRTALADDAQASTAGPETESPPVEGQARVKPPVDVAAWREDPAVKKAMDLFKGDIIDVRESKTST
jgi:DNA polymerase III subunit gamma/tau